jgi:hypothetical protein
MRKILLLLGMLSAGCFSCKKQDVAPPAITVHVTSASFPPSEENSFVMYSAIVELRKTDGSFATEETISGTGSHTFERLQPGEYWINEKTSRHSEKFRLGPDETKEVFFYIP